MFPPRTPPTNSPDSSWISFSPDLARTPTTRDRPPSTAASRSYTRPKPPVYKAAPSTLPRLVMAPGPRSSSRRSEIPPKGSLNESDGESNFFASSGVLVPVGALLPPSPSHSTSTTSSPSHSSARYRTTKALPPSPRLSPSTNENPRTPTRSSPGEDAHDDFEILEVSYRTVPSLLLRSNDANVGEDDDGTFPSWSVADFNANYQFGAGLGDDVDGGGVSDSAWESEIYSTLSDAIIDTDTDPDTDLDYDHDVDVNVVARPRRVDSHCYSYPRAPVRQRRKSSYTPSYPALRSPRKVHSFVSHAAKHSPVRAQHPRIHPLEAPLRRRKSSLGGVVVGRRGSSDATSKPKKTNQGQGQGEIQRPGHRKTKSVVVLDSAQRRKAIVQTIAIDFAQAQALDHFFGCMPQDSRGVGGKKGTELGGPEVQQSEGEEELRSLLGGWEREREGRRGRGRGEEREGGDGERERAREESRRRRRKERPTPLDLSTVRGRVESAIPSDGESDTGEKERERERRKRSQSVGANTNGNEGTARKRKSVGDKLRALWKGIQPGKEEEESWKALRARDGAEGH